MIDSLTIFSKGGLVVYQYLESHETKETTNRKLNAFLSQAILDPTVSKQHKQYVLDNKDVVEWQEEQDDENKKNNFMAVAIYPKNVVVAARSSSNTGQPVLLTHSLLQSALHEYALLEQSNTTTSTDLSSQELFDKTFQVLRKQTLRRTDSNSNIGANHPRTTTTTQQHPSSNKAKKEKRVWGQAKVTEQAMAELDYSKDPNNSIMDDDNNLLEHSAALAEARAAYLPSSPDEVPAWDEPDEMNDNDDEDASTSNNSSWGTSLQGLFQQMAGTKVLTAQDLEVPLDEMHKMLTGKNVASDIAREITQTVQQKLIGQRLQSFARVKTAVRQALEAALSSILTPPKHRQVHLLRAVVTRRESRPSLFFQTTNSKTNRPYVICMVGINGVGKSTSLAKIAYYLKINGCRPMLAACDTFRSGAVEQLNVHAKCLDVPLFHQGYAKDPSAVAGAAIARAAEDNRDVVLVDTAGRMQNNVPLMKALSKLIVENEPDLVLFVCEALVGNDGMDQLDMFNKAFKSGGHSRQIDGIILTKFDAVGDKVGAALTMTHVSGAPIVFCGTGQKYTHLKPLSVQAVIKSLFA